MRLLMLAAIVVLLIGLSTRSPWDRFRRDDDYGIRWMLAVPGLRGYLSGLPRADAK